MITSHDGFQRSESLKFPVNNTTTVSVLSTDGALALLANESFLREWQSLFESCPHATVFQAPFFASTWYSVYQREWHPVIVRGTDADGRLVGLWLLAKHGKTHQLAHVGAHQAEYQGWLASQSYDESFVAGAWRALREEFRFATLRFKYLPASLADSLRRVVGTSHIDVRISRRPFAMLLSQDSAGCRQRRARKASRADLIV